MGQLHPIIIIIIIPIHSQLTSFYNKGRMFECDHKSDRLKQSKSFNENDKGGENKEPSHLFNAEIVPSADALNIQTLLFPLRMAVYFVVLHKQRAKKSSLGLIKKSRNILGCKHQESLSLKYIFV